jgi:hypothetical protein
MFEGRKMTDSRMVDNQKIVLRLRKKLSKGVSEQESLLTIVSSPRWGQNLKIPRVSDGNRKSIYQALSPNLALDWRDNAFWYYPENSAQSPSTILKSGNNSKPWRFLNLTSVVKIISGSRQRTYFLTRESQPQKTHFSELIILELWAQVIID